MLMGLSLRPIMHILLIDVSTQVAVSLITEENQIQQTRVVFNLLTHILKKRKSFCFIFINLQDFNFVRKSLWSSWFSEVIIWKCQLLVGDHAQIFWEIP